MYTYLSTWDLGAYGWNNGFLSAFFSVYYCFPPNSLHQHFLDLPSSLLAKFSAFLNAFVRHFFDGPTTVFFFKQHYLFLFIAFSLLDTGFSLLCHVLVSNLLQARVSSHNELAYSKISNSRSENYFTGWNF